MCRSIRTGQSSEKVIRIRVFQKTHSPRSFRGNAFAHGVWDSLADYPLNPQQATEGLGRNPFGRHLAWFVCLMSQPGQSYLFRKLGVSQASVFTLLMKDRMYMSGDCIPGVLTLQHHLHNGLWRNITNCGGERRAFAWPRLSCNVPPGWERVEKKRPSGLTAGRIDVSYISPGGKTVRSKGDLEKYIRKKGLKLDVNAFNFSAGAKKKGRTMSSAESSTSQSPNSETSITTPIESLDGTESVTDSCITPQESQSNQSDAEEAAHSSFLTEHHDLKSKNVIIMPVNDSEDLYTVGHGTHWSTLVYDRAANKFFYLDSVNNLNLPAAKIVAQKLGSHLGLDIETSEFVSLKSPQQSNGFDCGVFVCWNVESLVQDITMDSALNFGFLQNATLSAKEVITKRSLIAYVLYSSLQITKEELYDLMIKKPGKRHEEGQYTTNVLERGERRQGGDSQWFKVASSRHYGQKQRGPAISVTHKQSLRFTKTI
ncbi:SUMO1 sentrin specific peptidase 8 [Homalodisca vitripennis]|nr:SUMO1 sentrin specific peptidase 8 [Homalodisca vitripennis]